MARSEETVGARRKQRVSRDPSRREESEPSRLLGHATRFGRRSVRQVHAQHLRLPYRYVADAQVDLRRQGGRCLLVYRRHRLGHRPQLHRLRSVVQWRDLSHSMKAHRTSPIRTASGILSRSTRGLFSIPRGPRSARSCAGEINILPCTTFRVCASWVR